MKEIYLSCGISRQGHHEDWLRQRHRQTLALSYLGLMMECRDLHPGMGLRTMYAHLRPEGIGRDAFIALGMREGLRLRVLPNAVRTTYAVPYCRYGNLLGNRRFRGVNRVWVSDLFYFTRFDKHLYVVLIMDAYSRRIVGYSAADNMYADNFLVALERALTLRGVADYEQQLVHHSDRGSQYVSQAYTSTLEDYGIQISMCQNVLENAHAERVNGTIKNDYLMRYPMKGPGQFALWVDRAIDAYNHRFHNRLGCTPMEFEAQLLGRQEADCAAMEIFTINRSQIADSSGQLDLFNELSFT